jgi:2EXR family
MLSFPALTVNLETKEQAFERKIQLSNNLSGTRPESLTPDNKGEQIFLGQSATTESQENWSFLRYNDIQMNNPDLSVPLESRAAEPGQTFTKFGGLATELRLRIWKFAILEETEQRPRLALVHSLSDPWMPVPTLLQVSRESRTEAQQVWKSFQIISPPACQSFHAPRRFIYVHKDLDAICCLTTDTSENRLEIGGLLQQMAHHKMARLVISSSWFRTVFLSPENRALFKSSLDPLMVQGKLKVITVVSDSSVSDASDAFLRVVKKTGDHGWQKYYQVEFNEKNKERGWGWKGKLKVKSVEQDL